MKGRRKADGIPAVKKNNNNKIEVVIVKLVKIVKLNKFATFSLFMFWSKIVISPKRIDLYPNG